MQPSAGAGTRFYSERLRDSVLPFYRGVIVREAQRRLLTLCSKLKP